MVEPWDQMISGTKKNLEDKKRNANYIVEVQENFKRTMTYITSELHLRNTTKKYLMMYHLGVYLMDFGCIKLG